MSLSNAARWGVLGFLLMLAAPIQAYSNVTFTDLTGKKYEGKDADLTGFALSGMGINCSSSNVYSGEAPILSWDFNSLRKNSKGHREEVVSYKVHFRVKGRKGSLIHEQSFDYLKNEHGGFNKKQFVNHEHDRCNRDFVWFSRQIDFSHSTVEYWISKIRWKTFEIQKPEPDNAAFSMEDMVIKD